MQNNKTIKQLKYLLIYLLVLFFSISVSFAAVLNDNYPKIANIEEIVFGKSSPGLKINDRLNAIENNLFGETYPKDSLFERTKRIVSYVLGPTNNDYDTEVSEDTYPDNPKKPLNITVPDGYENVQTNEISELEFVNILLSLINDERSFKGLLPLIRDDIAMKVALEQAKSLISKGYLSYFNLQNQGPDERYTLSGGTGALIEIVKGFELEKIEIKKDTKKNKIKLSELLAKQLLQAIHANTDDSEVLLNPYNTHFGLGIALSKDGKKFVSVTDFVTKGGEVEPIKPVVNLGETLQVSGKINKPFKFKALSVAYFDGSKIVDLEPDNLTFDNESIEPYFPPQDYIAFGDTGKGNLLKVLKGIGVIGAIGAAPFTGGASAILAPALLNSIQNGPPKEIPLKGGIKYISKTGNFSGNIPLNYGGKSGLYFVSVLAEISGVSYPVVISRRTIKVNSLLSPVSFYVAKQFCSLGKQP